MTSYQIYLQLTIELINYVEETALSSHQKKK